MAIIMVFMMGLPMVGVRVIIHVIASRIWILLDIHELKKDKNEWI
jgi:hypothetical protein